jgi:hypothetical protein
LALGGQAIYPPQAAAPSAWGQARQSWFRRGRDGAR